MYINTPAALQALKFPAASFHPLILPLSPSASVSLLPFGCGHGQVANYPSQLSDPGHNNPRKKAHVDSGTLTLLASEDWLPGSSWQAGDGGLQLLTPQQEWLEVQVPQGECMRRTAGVCG